MLTKAEWREYMRERKDLTDRLPRVVERRPLHDVVSDKSEDRVGEEDEERYSDVAG